MAALETVGQVAQRAVELGIAAPEALARLGEDVRDEPLSDYGDNTDALISVMVDLGVGVQVFFKTGGDLVDGYRDTFDRFSACTGGAVAITNVELTDGDTRIQMRVNGRDVSWHLDHRDFPTYLDAFSIYEISTFFAAEDDTDTRVFVSLLDDDGGSYVFADPSAFTVLAGELGIELD
jgi:hypothetical protein